jgi:hypothetical protein
MYKKSLLSVSKVASMQNPFTRSSFFLRASLLITLSLGGAATVYGATYQPLVGLPALEGPGGGTSLAGYFNQLYMLTVAVGAILAFLRIAFAGAKWSLSEIITDKSQAKNDIQGALLGLAILLIPFIVLNTIYSGLTNLNILERANTIPTTATPATGGSVETEDPAPTGTRVRSIAQEMTCPPMASGTRDMDGAPIYLVGVYDCSDHIRTCQDREGSSYEQTRPDLITCTYLEVTTCTPTVNETC